MVSIWNGVFGDEDSAAFVESGDDTRKDGCAGDRRTESGGTLVFLFNRWHDDALEVAEDDKDDHKGEDELGRDFFHAINCSKL